MKGCSHSILEDRLLSQHVFGGIKENHEIPQNSSFPCRCSNPGPSEYEEGVASIIYTVRFGKL
jgi:hypothetical protein